MSKMDKNAAKMLGHASRNKTGQLRKRRSDTHIGTIEKQYGVDLKVRSDMHLETYLDQGGHPSLSKMLHTKK